MLKKLKITLVCQLLFAMVFAQGTSKISGTVYDLNTNETIDFVTVFLEGTQISTQSDDRGNFILEVPSDIPLTIVFTRVGYRKESISLPAIPQNAIQKITVKLLSTESSEITIIDSNMEDLGMVREEVEVMTIMPTVSGNLESVLPSIALGASGGSGGELSSQYNVRGGNYDENLIYVNDYEVFRPQLLRSGQQEGLTFPNIDLIQNLSFSSGGFEAKYGDKLSSVLDVRYKVPNDFRHSVSFSALGASAHTEGKLKLKNRPFRYLIGARYKTTRYLLGSLDLDGEYQPNHTDLQTYLTYDLNSSWQLELIGNYNNSVYNFIPESGRSTTGNIGLGGSIVSLFTIYDGAEKDRFTNAMIGAGATYFSQQSSRPLFLKFKVSAYNANESEAFDILGFYRLSEIDAGLGSDTYGEEIVVLGTGAHHEYVRNSLQSTIYNFQHKGGVELQSDDIKSNFLEWGMKVQNETFLDDIKEWEKLDSAGYSIPYSQEEVILQHYLKTNNRIQSTRLTAFVQNSFTKQNDNYELKWNLGARINYWTLNQEFFVAPRTQLLFKPKKWKKDVSFKFATGLYYQPAFYREIRMIDGTVNTNLLSQKSAHFVAGMTYDYKWEKISDKPFRLITEIYYKPLWAIVPYDVENVRIRYTGMNNATGYAIGLDARINGEFVPGAESWINFSLLKTMENWDDIQHTGFKNGEIVEVESVPRPTDKFFTLNMFFQDYLPMNERFKANINLSFGSGLPFGLNTDNVVFRNQLRFPSYKRFDIGFSFQLWEEGWRTKKPNHPLRWTRNAWVSLEVFNLMNIRNVASYSWIKDVYNREYPIPNRLTSRRINLRFRFDF